MERMSKEQSKEKRIGLRPFSEVVTDMAGGDVERELTSLLGEVVRACEGTKKKGKLTITLNIAPGPKLMQMTADIKATVPKTTLEATAFYTDDKGSLTIDNPRQTKMFDGPRAITGDKPDSEN